MRAGMSLHIWTHFTVFSSGPHRHNIKRYYTVFERISLDPISLMDLAESWLNAFHIDVVTKNAAAQ
jgi:hypothetical protein